MTKINDPANLGTDLFGYKINYNQREGSETPNLDFPNLKVKPKFNGNIAEVFWKTSSVENESLKSYSYSYSYSYDELNRLSGGFYQRAGYENAKEYFEINEYDLNGNITRLHRSEGILQGSSTALKIDNLRYDYEGNKLTKVTEEQIGNSNGYPYLANHNTITYDDNGNMTSHKDKAIASIQYNFLNLPNQINGTSGKFTKTTNYTYRADGVKVGKSYSQNSAATTTLYLDGFQYKFSANTISGSELQFVPTSEGYFDFVNYVYIYNYTDHLGNVRLSYSDADQDGVIQPRDMNVRECTDMGGGNVACIDIWKPGEIVEINNYYPFGLMHNFTATTTNAYQYKYNGKELQETGMYDYGARFYMPDIGRWGVVDPLAEKYSSMSTYAYVANNPIIFVDPDGKDIILYYMNSKGKMETYDYKYGAQYKGANKYVQAFHRSANALIKSGAGNILKSLESKSEMVWVRGDDLKDGESPHFSSRKMTIKWSPTIGVDTDGDADLTPTEVLNHEMDHALEYIKNPEKMIKALDTPDKQYGDKEEKRVITRSEQSTSKKMGRTKGKETTRKNHDGDLIKTAGVTTTQPPATEIQEVIITVKKKK